MTLNGTYHSQTVTIHRGNAFVVVLEGNPTTGFLWEIAACDPAMLKLERSEFKPHTRADGSGGQHIMHFVSLQAGQTDLKLIYHRRWEKNIPPLKTFAITLIIKP